MEELKKEFNNKSSKNYKKDNQKLFNNLISEIGCFSALDYIFSNNPYYDYEKEINYLFENIVLPNNSENKYML